MGTDRNLQCTHIIRTSASNPSAIACMLDESCKAENSELEGTL